MRQNHHYYQTNRWQTKIATLPAVGFALGLLLAMTSWCYKSYIANENIENN